MCNENIFINPLTRDDKYWLGFLLADGCISPILNRISLGLATKDIGHLEKFKLFTGTKTKILLTDYVRINVHSKILVERLSNLGITQAKTKTVKVIEGLEYDPDFWRGVIDGDGSLGTTYNNGGNDPYISLCGNKHIVQGFIDYCQMLAPSKSRVKMPKPKQFKNKPDHYDYFKIGKKALIVIKSLYGIGGEVLKRKQEIADKLT